MELYDSTVNITCTVNDILHYVTKKITGAIIILHCVAVNLHIHV